MSQVGVLRVVRLLVCMMLSAVIVVLSSFIPLSAQAVDATLTGVVTDESGAVVTQVQLTLADPAGGVQRTVTSDGRGHFVFAGIPPGTYELTAVTTGFAPVRMDRLTLAAGDQRSLIVTLKVGALAESVSVFAGPNAVATIGKTQQSLREIPQSVSIIARDQMDAQGFTSLPEVMKYATGVTVTRIDGAGLFNSYNARGFGAESFQLDGLNVRVQHNMADLDLSLYDRVEVLRGPAGLFQGAGQAGVTVNLVRKRATAQSRLNGVVSAGSWRRHRAELDAGGALSSKRVRGRIAGVYEGSDSYLDAVNRGKQLAYATVEVDLSKSTTLSVGGTYQAVESVFNAGLPAYADGRQADVPRSTAMVADWNDVDMDTTDVFAELERRLHAGGMFKAAVRRQARDMFYKGIRANSAIAADGLVRLDTPFVDASHRDTAADVFLASPFTLAGGSHRLTVGADYRTGDSDTINGAGPELATSIFSHSSHIPEPELVEKGNQRSRLETSAVGMYGQLHVKPRPALTLIAGGRVSWWESTRRDPLTGTVTSSYEAAHQTTPYVAAVFDVSGNLSLYGSYTDIFQPQNQRTVDGAQLAPRIGSQYEGGVKGELLDRRVGLHAAAFLILDENRSLADPLNTGFFIAAGEVRSHGFETEIQGRLTSGWSMVAGYAYTSTEYVKAAVDQEGTPFSPFTPKQILTAWSNYTVTDGFARGLVVGAGVRAASASYTVSGGARFDASPYATGSLQVAYALRKHMTLTLNVNNMFDAAYYERVGPALRQNHYGEPRNMRLTLRVGL